MVDLYKLGIKLLKEIPNSELQGKFFGILGIHATLVFANRVKEGLTQQQLADKANVDVTTIHKIEGGHNSVPMTDLEKIFVILGIVPEDIRDATKDLEELLKEIEQNQNEYNHSRMIKSKKKRQLRKYMKKCIKNEDLFYFRFLSKTHKYYADEELMKRV